MKKLIRILLLFSILSTTSCDFLRQVAGRPTEDEVELKRVAIEKHTKAIADSIKLVQEKARKIERERQDSIQGMAAMEEMGVHICYDFRYGKPVKPLDRKYSVVIGVFRQNATAAKLMISTINKGYYPYLIWFPNEIKTVCICGGNSLSAIADTINVARTAGACPKDAWLYVNPIR